MLVGFLHWEKVKTEKTSPDRKISREILYSAVRFWFAIGSEFSIVCEWFVSVYMHQNDKMTFVRKSAR